MDLTSKINLLGLLKKYSAIAKKGMGQYFLIDKSVLMKIIEAADLDPQETVLEIGPGIGVLTQELAKRAKRVIAVEKDQKMVEILKETLKEFKNVEVISGDALKMQNTKYKILDRRYRVVANLPYYITSPVIRKLIEFPENCPSEIVLMVQKEVAQRICAKPPDMNLLAVSVQFYSKPEIISYISKNSFWPQPKVDSAILRITPLINTRGELTNADLFFKIVKAGFSQPRKQLINNLSRGLQKSKEEIKNWLLKNKIQPEKRAETLIIENWISLVENLPN